MIFLNEFNFILKIFYFIGLKPSTIDKTFVQKFIDFITVAITSTVCLILTVYLIFVPHFSSYGIIFTLIYYGSLCPSLLMILTANWQCYFSKTTYQIIINQIDKLEKHVDEKSLRLSMDRLAFRYKLKTVILFILFFQSQILVFVEVWHIDPDRAFSSLLISSVRATYPLELLHFVLYSDIAAMFLNRLNEKVQHSPIFVHRSGKIDFLKYVKLVHSDLWKLIVGVNKFFGWNLLFTAIFWFINITHQLYWIFLAARDEPKALELAG